MSGFSGLDFMAKALENAQKQADQMLGIDEHAAKEAMEESASEAQIFKAVAGDARTKLTGAAKKVAGSVEGVIQAKKTPIKPPASDSDFFSMFSADFDTPSRRRGGGKAPSDTAVANDVPALDPAGVGGAPSAVAAGAQPPAVQESLPDAPAGAAREPAAEQGGGRGEEAATNPLRGDLTNSGAATAGGARAGEGSSDTEGAPPAAPADDSAAWLSALPGPPSSAGRDDGAGAAAPAAVAPAPASAGGAGGTGGAGGAGAPTIEQLQDALARKGVQVRGAPPRRY